ncbi:MAG: M3 family metallopeptidase [Planctomycetota bacterium]
MQDELPTTPSLRLSLVGKDVVAARGGARGTVQRRITGELDWITLKALAKQREHRYPSALAFAEDLERWLRHQPVLAAPPGAGYQLRKFAQRHRVALTAATAVFLSLVIGLVLSLRATGQAVRAEQRTELALNDMRVFYDLARDAVGGLVDAADQRLVDVPQAEPVRRQMLADAIRFYAALQACKPTDLSLRIDLLAASERIGILQRRLGQTAEGLATLEQCVADLDDLLSATKDGAVVVLDKAQLAGLAAGEIEAAFAAAKERKIDGKWVLPLQNTTQQPPLASLVDRSLRQRLLAASTSRGATDGADDTRVIVMQMAKLRAKQALLLGFHDYASYALDDQMAKTPAAAISLLTDMVPAAVAKARGEVAKMQAIVDQGKPSFPLAACDWQFYAEQVRKAEYDLDEAAIKPYFLLDRVLSDGVFFAAHELYGLSFIERKDLPVYHPDVRLFEVLEKDRVIALVYTDYYKRDNKSGGAWMDSFVDQASLLGTLPVVFNVCNFQKPIAGQPALLSFDDVTTMFHEFGHALHGLLSEVRYPLLSGTAVPRDYVEFPSQFNEHWAMEPRVFANYAKHWQTGAPMPAETVAKIQKSKTFDQGYATTEYLAAALLDLAWHSVAVADAPVDVHAFEAAKLREFGLALSEVPPRYRSTYFAHIWGGGYAASYYAYMWAEVLDHDAYDWFVEHGGMTRENGKRYRDMVLSRGGTIECGAMYRAFRGRDPKVDPLLRERGLR